MFSFPAFFALLLIIYVISLPTTSERLEMSSLIIFPSRIRNYGHKPGLIVDGYFRVLLHKVGHRYRKIQVSIDFKRR